MEVLKCNQCGWLGGEELLVKCQAPDSDVEEIIDGCPNCNDDASLMNIEEL